MRTFIMRGRAKAKVPGLALRNVCDARGFSLIELLFVVAIVVILSAIALPSFLNSSRPFRLRNDANGLVNLVTMARMRAATTFSRVRLNCTTSPAPATCKLESMQYTSTPATGVWVFEPGQTYLSAGVSFGFPPSMTSGFLPNQSVAASQGNAQQNTPTVTTNPLMVFNSRGLPVDPTIGLTTSGTVLTPDYALYLTDQTGKYMAVSVNMTGRPSLYTYGMNGALCTVPAAPCYYLLPE